MVAHVGWIAAHAQDVCDPDYGSRQEVRLDGDPVTVPPRHLEDWLGALRLELKGRADGRHLHDRARRVGQVKCVDPAGKVLRRPEDLFEVHPFWWVELGRDQEFVGVEKFMKGGHCDSLQNGRFSPRSWLKELAEFKDSF